MEDFDELKPRTTAACLRRYWGKVDHLLAEGVSQIDIVKVLNAEGVNVTVQAFRVYLHQHRKKCKAQTVGSKSTPRLPILPPGTGGVKPAQQNPLTDTFLTPRQRSKAYAAKFVDPVLNNPLFHTEKENES